jgi:hypothetical protein
MSYSWGASRTAAVGRAVALGAAGSPTVQQARLAPAPSSEKTGTGHGPEQLRVAAELAPMVEVWQRLLAQHVPDRAGRCRTCTKGGTGLPTTPWPCVIHTIADRARSVYDAEHRR